MQHVDSHRVLAQKLKQCFIDLVLWPALTCRGAALQSAERREVPWSRASPSTMTSYRWTHTTWLAAVLAVGSGRENRNLAAL